MTTDTKQDNTIELMAPSGCRIVGTVEKVLVMYPVRVWREPEGTVSFEYTGGESKVYDECAEIVTRVPEGGSKPELVFQDEDGTEWLASELVPVPPEEDEE